MDLCVISYQDLLDKNNDLIRDQIKSALHMTGIMGVRDVPQFRVKSKAYIESIRAFSALDLEIKMHYAPDRDAGFTEGYEVGAEQFLDTQGQWQSDDKKVSFYACVPDNKLNKWPREVDIKTPYLELGELMFATGKEVLDFLGEGDDLEFDSLVGYGRMLHYLKVGASEYHNPNWCGAHLDHGVFTALMPAYYFSEGIEVDEPEEAGLYIRPTNGTHFEKINAADKSVMLFQIGEFLQLASNDAIRATKHLVKKAKGDIERYTFALFMNAQADKVINSRSELTRDPRYISQKSIDGSISYGLWETASYAQYRA
jgi:isopenicillin N synthase-like dioxygenase